MILETLAVHGFFTFPETASLDLRDIPAGSQIALVGENGAGKTTLLEAAMAALYREFPSKGCDLFAGATERDSSLDITFAVEGRGVFQARVSVDAAQRDAKAVLSLRGAAYEPALLLNDGKVSTYDETIARELPPKALLLASAFGAQHRNGSFVTLDRKGRKALFATLLGLDHYEAMHTTAKSAAGLIEQTRLRLVARRDAIARTCSADLLRELNVQGATLLRACEAAEADQATLRTRLADLETRLSAVRERAAEYVAAVQQRGLIDANRTATVRERAIRQAQVEDLHERLTADLARFLRERDEEIAGIETRIANNRKLQQSREAVDEAVARVRDDDLVLAASREEQRRLAGDLTAAHRAARDAARAVSDGEQAISAAERAARDAETLQQVPCRGAGEYAQCRFLADAERAAARVPTLRPLVDAQPTRIAEREAADRAVARLEADQERLRLSMETITKCRAEASLIADKAGSLAAADARIAELTDKRAETVSRAEQRAKDASNQHQAAREAALAAVATLDETLARLDGERSQADERALATADAHGEAQRVQRDLADARTAWDDATRTLAVVTTKREDLARRRAEVDTAQGLLAEFESRLAILDAELIDWQTLARMTGRDGLPVLEIDAAGPTVSALANDLLNSCFGPQFTLELITQDAKLTKGKDGSTTKEVFDLKVYDNTAGGAPRDLALLSGGQQVIVDEALKNALAIYANQRSPMPIRTCWRDETTGALHPTTVPPYMAMLRRVQQIAGFHHLFFVTHNPEAAAQADAQIVVEHGRARIQFPPYAEITA